MSLSLPFPADATSMTFSLNGVEKGTVTPGQAINGHKMLGGDPSLAPLDSGFGAGNHHMPGLDANGRVDVLPGNNHISLYFGVSGGANTYTTAQIAAAEGIGEGAVPAAIVAGLPVTGDSNYFWGQHPNYAMDDDLRFAVTGALWSSVSGAPISTWIHWERGGSFLNMGQWQGQQGHLRHPIVHKTYGSGALPIFESKLQLAGAPEDNVVFEELDYSKVFDGVHPDARVKAVWEFNSSPRAKNWFINKCDLSGKDHSFQRWDRMTLVGNRINDSIFNRPDGTDTTWDTPGNPDRIQGFFGREMYGFALMHNTVVHAGWDDSRDLVNEPPEYNSGANGLPENQYSHGFYMQDLGTDMTFVENVLAYNSSHGGKFQFGAHVVHNVWFENPHHFFFNNSNTGDQDAPNISTVYQNVMIGQRWVWPRNSATLSGIVWGRGYGPYVGAVDPSVHENAVLHYQEPTSTDPYETGKPATSAAPGAAASDPLYSGGSSEWDNLSYTPKHFIGNFLEYTDENISISDTELNALTLHKFVDADLSQPVGTATTLEVVDWCRTAELRALEVCDFIIRGLGGDVPTDFNPTTLNFVPNIRGSGWRMDDDPTNYMEKRRPVDGDSINLSGADPVTGWISRSLSTLNCGSGVNLKRYGGRLKVATLTGSGAIEVSSTAEIWATNISSANLAISLADGGLFIDGTASGISVTASGSAECIIASGGALTISAGQTLTIDGPDVAIGVDGGAGTATLTLAGTLAFTGSAVSPLTKAYTGLSGLDAFNQRVPVAVTGNLVLGGTLDLSGAPSGTYNIATGWDSITGSFGTVTGGTVNSTSGGAINVTVP